MKTFGYISLAALLTLASCTNEINEEGFVDKENTISFNAYSSKTRAYESGDVTIKEMKEGSFGVVGYKSDNQLYLGTTGGAIEQCWNQSNGNWEYKNKTEMKYWPGGNMDFYAFFPYSTSVEVASTDNSDSDPVVTFTNETGNQDVLFTRAANVAQTDYVPLYFKHAFAKIKSINIDVEAPDVEVAVSKVNILNTSTKGKIKLYNINGGEISYEATSNDEIRSFDFSTSPKTISLSNSATDGVKLFDNDANAYIFATNTGVQHNVRGTSKTMWDGSKEALSGKKVAESGLICFELECKVKAKDHYYVGSESTTGKLYIPLRGTSSNSATISEFLAGRRYIYNIVMSSNVGYDENGNPIMLAPIRFSVNEITAWNDVDITIVL